MMTIKDLKLWIAQIPESMDDAKLALIEWSDILNLSFYLSVDEDGSAGIFEGYGEYRDKRSAA